MSRCPKCDAETEGQKQFKMCDECRIASKKAYLKQYYEEHKDRIREQQSKWREKNRESLREYHRQWTKNTLRNLKEKANT